MADEVKEKSSTKTYLVLVVLASAIIAIGLAVGLLLQNDSDSSPSAVPATAGSPTRSPVSLPTSDNGVFPGGPTPGQPTSPPILSSTCLPENYSLTPLSNVRCNGRRREVIYFNQLSQITGSNILQDPTTPQGKAYAFLINYDPFKAGSCSVAGLVERFALMTLYFATNGDFWTSNLGWCEGSPHCNWDGVICTNGVVTGLELESNNLSGDFPLEIYALRQLESINVFANSLTGPIPNFSLNTRLQDIDLQQNLLTGDVVPLTLPSTVRSYKVSGNRLSGTIPASIANWSQLSTLWIGRNQVSGSIPTTIGNLRSLRSLYVYENDLNGAIPSELGRIPMEEIWLSKNFFDKAIPTQLFYLGSLTMFRMENNVLTGSIPTWVGLLTNLQHFRVDSNNLGGSLPSELAELTDLVELNIGSNFWAGNLPNIFTNMNQLETFDMSDTEIGGPIPATLFTLPSIENVYMSNSKLTGNVPNTFANSQTLKSLRLDGSTNVSGDLPAVGQGRLQKLEELLVQGTSMSGSMPPSICELRSAGRLDVLEADCAGAAPALACDFPDCCTSCE